MSHPARPRATLLILLTTCALVAGEVPADPWASLRASDNVLVLAQLRPRLALTPSDQLLLGQALMAYVNLSVQGDASSDGGDGPWLDYASELAARRVAARGGAPCTSLEQEAPELWVRLVRGERAGVVQALGRWSAAPQQPAFRALHAAASGDWRPLRSLTAATPHECYAALRLRLESAPAGVLEPLYLDQPALPPAAVSEVVWDYSGGPVMRSMALEMSVEQLDFTSWMLASGELGDAQALSLLGELAAALEEPLAPASDRAAAWRQVRSACLRPRPRPLRALATAARICTSLLDQRHGMVAADGGLQLYGLGDLAAWNRDRLVQTLHRVYYLARREGDDLRGTDVAFGAILREVVPGSLIAARFSLGYQYTGGMRRYDNDKPEPSAWEAFAHALAREVEAARGHGIAVLADAVDVLAVARPVLAAPLVRRLLARDPGVGRRARLESLLNAAADSGLPALVLPRLAHWARQAPMDLALEQLVQQWSPTTPMLELDASPLVRTWIDVQVDNRKLPWPQLGLSRQFAIVWRGTLRVDLPGRYILGLESDEDSLLVVGDDVLSNRGFVTDHLARSEVELVAGALPLRLDFLHSRANAMCRLLWQPPGTDRMVPIPSDHLRAPDGTTAGLQAQGYDCSAGNGWPLPTRHDLAFCQRVPWNHPRRIRIAMMWFNAGHFAEAAADLRTIRTFDDDPAWALRLHQCLLYQQPVDIAGALAIIAEQPMLYPWRGGWELPRTIDAFRQAGALPELLRVVGRRDADPLWPYVLGEEALDRGDIVAAHGHFARQVAALGTGESVGYAAKHRMLMIWAILERRTGREPAWTMLEKVFKDEEAPAGEGLVLDWLSGAVSWEDSLARMPTVKDGDQLRFYHGLVALTTGDHAAAQQDFATALAVRPDLPYAPTCRGLLTWYATQTPESLGAIATAKPLKAAPSAAGADDF